MGSGDRSLDKIEKSDETGIASEGVSRQAQDELRKQRVKQDTGYAVNSGAEAFLQTVPLELYEDRKNQKKSGSTNDSPDLPAQSDDPRQRDANNPSDSSDQPVPAMDEEKWKNFRVAIENGDKEALKIAFEQTLSDQPFIWHVMADRYIAETGRDFDEDTRSILGELNYSTVKCNFTSTSRQFPFEDVSRMNSQLPIREDEERARQMYPEVSSLLSEGDYSKITANEVRFRDRYDSDRPETNYVGEHWERGWKEDLADSGYHVPLVYEYLKAKGTSIGPMQMKVKNIEELKAEDPRLAGLNPTARENAPVFVAAYMDRARRRLENDDSFKTWVNGESEGAGTSLIKIRQEYLEAKRNGDKEGMRNALLCTYNPANYKTSANSSKAYDNWYANPYRNEKTESRRVLENSLRLGGPLMAPIK